MNVRFSMTIAGQPIDLFQDEVVKLTRQVKDVSDLSQARTDFTQQFTIPSSPTNDEVFSNYFEENIVLGNWNAYLKLDATIFIHGLPVFVGCVELSGVKYANGLARQYDIIFYGQAKNAFALFGEDTLIDVDWSELEHSVSATNITNSWQQTFLNGDIIYPIIDWHVGYTYSSQFQIKNNIGSDDVGGIQINDLRPIIRIRKMLELCFANAGYTLNGSLLDRPEFDDWYVAPMGVAGPVQNYTNEQAKIEVTRGSFTIAAQTAVTGNGGYLVYPYNTEVTDPLNLYSTSTHIYQVPYNGEYTIELEWVIGALPTPPTAGYVNVFATAILVNGNPVERIGYTLVQTYTKTTTLTLNQGDQVTIGYANLWGATITSAKFKITQVPYGIADSLLNLKWIMPTTKIVDFIRSFMQMTNSILVPVDATTFELHNIEDWYANAVTKDWTKYIDTKEISHQKMDIPKAIMMSHAEGLDLANQEIISKYNRKFGMIDFSPQVDFAREEFTIETIFNISVPSVMREINDVGNVIGLTDLQIPVMLDKDNKPVQQPLTMFFYAGYNQVFFPYYFNGTQYYDLAIVSPYSGSPVAKTSYSLAYGLENVLAGDMALNTLFKLYYENYLSRYYSTKSRIVTMDAVIPVGEWLNLSLNDTIDISGNYYKIQKIDYDILNERAVIEFITYNDVTTITLDSDGNTAEWTDGTTDPSRGATLIGNGIVGRQLTNSRPWDALNYTGIPQQTTYNDQNVGGMKVITNQLFNRFRRTVMTAYNDTPVATATIGDDPVFIGFEGYELMGQERMVCSLVDSWIYDEYGGQFRLTAIVSVDKTANKHAGFAIFVDGVRTLAYTSLDKTNGSVTITTMLNLGAEQKVQVAFWNEDNESHSITIHNVRLIVELQ
jgi:hypothetical protein